MKAGSLPTGLKRIRLPSRSVLDALYEMTSCDGYPSSIVDGYMVRYWFSFLMIYAPRYLNLTTDAASGSPCTMKLLPSYMKPTSVSPVDVSMPFEPAKFQASAHAFGDFELPRK